MATPEGAITAPDVSSSPAPSVSNTADSSSASQGTSAPIESPAGGVTADVQGESQPTAPPDPLADLPSVEELEAQASQGVKYAAALANLRGVVEPLRTQHAELTQKFEPYQSALERFEQPEQLASVLELHDSLIGWESDPETGEPIPATQAGAQRLAEQYPQHADFLVADLLGLPTTDPATGRQVPRIDYVLESLAADPDQRARALKILGGVEPSAVAPQWQPTADELAVVKPELQDTYRALPYEEREELKLNSPDYINRVLERERFTQQLQAEKEQNDQLWQQQAQQHEVEINQKAQAAGNDFINTQLNQALTTFHEAVVQQCNFVKPLDPANLPQGFTPEQATQMNQQIAAANKAEAAQITGLVVSLFNPQTKAYVLPLLKEIGAVDDKLLAQLDQAASAFGSNGRTYANLEFRHKNGSPTAPDPRLNNEASTNLKRMIGYANQIRGKLMETRSQFFELTAQQHNSTLNGGTAVRPPVNGTGYNPTTAPAAASLPAGKLSRAEIERLYG